MRYGNYDLQVGDRDSTLTFGGSVRSGANGDVVPGPNDTGFVKQLQQDLIETGFRIVGTADGIFGRNTTFALREFQAYSKMPNVAKQNMSSLRYSDGLAQFANPNIYAGPVSGVANAETRTRLARWIADDLRCPVVIESWSMSQGARTNLFTGASNIYSDACQNLWAHDEIPNSGPRMFARDFSGYYTIPAGHTQEEVFALGDHVSYLTWSGPRAKPPIHTWPEGEILPANLIGTAYASLSAEQKSTFRVIRAVAEVECLGFFDSVNAYDNAIQSIGPCHWTLGIVAANGSVDEGELCAFLAYLKHADRAAFDQAFGFFGASINENWVDSNNVANGSDLFQASSRKYTGWLSQQDDTSQFVRIPAQEDDANFFKHWHWFYRMVMAGRTISGFQLRMYDFARIRLRDLMATPFQNGAGGLANGSTLGDVFTSERAMALLLRWHVRYPARVVNGGQVASSFNSSTVGTAQTAFQNAGLTGAPASWGNTEEEALVDGIMTEVANLGNNAFEDTMEYVRDWPSNWGNNPRGYQLPVGIGRLSSDRSSFDFDDTGLPPSP